MKSVAVVFVVVLMGPFAQGQNLVPNGSFEDLRNLPVKPNPRRSFEFEPLSGFRPYQSNLNHWFAASATTPDLRINSPAILRKCAARFEECDEPRTGDNCVGIITFMQNKETSTYREYVQVKLKRPLREGVRTFVELWVAKERQAKLVSNNIGCYFSENKIAAGAAEVIQVIPSVNDSSILNLDRKEWRKISGEFIATAASQYLTIGNFYSNEDTGVQEYERYVGSTYTPPYAYYLIDDVRVWQEGDKKDRPAPLVINKPLLDEPIVIEDLHFEHDKWTIANTESLKLQETLSQLKQNNTFSISISGHTDGSGSSGYNQILSEKRAKSVAEFFMSSGVDKGRISWKGYGDTQPLVTESGGSGEQKNRRVEIILREE